MNLCKIYDSLSTGEQAQFNIVKRMIEKKTPAEKLESFIKKISIKFDRFKPYASLSGDDLISTLTKDLMEQDVPEHKKYVHKEGRPLLSMNDFNRAGLTRTERTIIKNEIKTNIVDRCLFDVTTGSGEIRSLDKMNENILSYRLDLMLELAKRLGIRTDIKTIEDVLYHPQGMGEYYLQNLLIDIEAHAEYEKLDKRSKQLYDTLTYFDTILLATFENIIELDSEYQDDGFVYAHKYVYKGPGANMRKGYQDNKAEGFADAFENMSNMTKLVSEYIPRYAILIDPKTGERSEVKRGYVGEKMAVLLFAELWDFVTSLYNSSVFRNKYPSSNPDLYIAVVNAIDKPTSADWSKIVKHYIDTRCSIGNANIRECMVGLNKHVFEKGQGTWLYEDFVSCIQKYRKTHYGIISKVRKNEHKYMEFNELRLWTDQQANYQLQDQLAYSSVVNHVRYSTPKERLDFAKQIGLKVLSPISFSVTIDGQDVTITINKKDSESAATFEIDIPEAVTDKAVLEFLLVHMGINISNDALNLLQSDLHKEIEGSQRGAGQILVKPRTYFRQSIAPLIGLWVNSVFDESFEIDGKEYKPIITFDKRYFGKDQLGVNNFAPYYMQLYPMASILQIVHNENTSNVIKNGKGNNVPTTQLTTIQQDGPTLYRSIKREEAAVKRKNAEQFRKRLVAKGSKTTEFESISQYNPTLSQPDFCRTDSMLSAGIANGPIVKESKELKAGELSHDELIYLFAQGIFSDSGYIYSQATANADKNLQALRGLALDTPIAYTDTFGETRHQNHTLRSIIDAAMKGDDSGAYEYYQLHNAKSLLALENNICHSYNCAFINDPDWESVNTIEALMTQLIKLRKRYIDLSKNERTKKLVHKVDKDGNLVYKVDKDGNKTPVMEPLFDWTLSSVKKRFKEYGLDFNETTFGVASVVRGSIKDGIFNIDEKAENKDPYIKDKQFECISFSKDMIRDIQIARRSAKGDFSILSEQSFFYEKATIEDLIDEVCDINTLTDNYYKELVKTQPLIADWTTETGEMILAKFTDGIREINLTTYSSADDIVRFKMLPSNLVKINPLIHAYHLVQFTVNAQMNEAYNGTRFSIGSKDDGIYVYSFEGCIPIDKEFNIALHDSDGKETNAEKIKYKKYVEEVQKRWQKSYLKTENARMVNYYKRATVNGTREHRILHGDKYNIPEKVHTAIFSDPEGYAYLNSNVAAKCKAQDGSIWVTPWHALQMDVGAGEAKLPPGVRKTMYHDIDPVTGGATLLKMAEFPITNEMRRLSQKDRMNMEILLMKLANRKAITIDESNIENRIAITALNDFFAGNIFYEQQKYNLKDPDFGTYYAFTIQVEIKNGKLVITKSKWAVDENGEGDFKDAEVKSYEINTIYQIDRLFGGCYSCDKTKDGLVLGESQNKIVNKIICELNLKDNYIAYAVNEESIKNNIKNVNSASEWFDVTDNIPVDISSMGQESSLWTNTISTKFGGIILNALHEMDEDVDVARGVQMLSEMIQNGGQYGDVENIYANVRLGIQDALKDYTKALDADDSNKLHELIFDTIVDSLTNGKDKTKVSLAQEFVLGIKAARDEKKINISAFPISDKALYDLLITTIVGKINKEGIRARNAGFGGVKHPSFGVAKIYEMWVPDGNKFRKVYAKHNDVLNHIIDFMKTPEYEQNYKIRNVNQKDGTYEGWSANDFMTRIEKDGQLNPFISRTRSEEFIIDLGETIVYNDNGVWKSFEISSDREFQYFKRYIQPIIEKGSRVFYRNVFAGRRLRGYRTECTYKDESGKIHHDLMFNTNTNYLISSVKYIRDAVEKIKKIMRNEELWKKGADWTQIWNLIKTDNEARSIFIKNCKKITGYSYKDDFTIDDFEKRIEFIRHYFSRGDSAVEFKNFFKKKNGIDFDIWTKQNFVGTKPYNFIGFNEAFDERKQKDLDKLFEDTLSDYLENKRLIGISEFTEDKKFVTSERVENETGIHFIEHVGTIENMSIKKAEYMKSKGNISKQYLMGRKDSMFDILSKGPKYFENKLRALYTQPTDSKLLYDVAIYDKNRRPIYIKYDPDYKYADYFTKQGGEYTAVKNGIFKETNGSVYYKDKLVCNSSQMTSWIKHGDNGETYNVITVFNKDVFESIVKGKYGKRDGFVHRVVPRSFSEEDKKTVGALISQIQSLKPTSEQINEWRVEETDQATKAKLDGQVWLDTDDDVIARNNWKLGYQYYLNRINQFSEEHLLGRDWTGLNSRSFDKWLSDEANIMWESFKKQLNAIGTRIPSQAMQSMMAMECVGYLDADYNEEMASIEMTYIQGSDYDIDKDYITEYFVDETGYVGDGSKLQGIEAFKDHLDELPVPNGSLKAESIKYAKQVKSKDWDVEMWDDEEYEKYHVISYKDAKNIAAWLKEPNNNEDQFDKFLEILNAVNEGKKLHVGLNPDIEEVRFIPAGDYHKMIEWAKGRKGYANNISEIESWFELDRNNQGVVISTDRLVVDPRAYYVIADYAAHMNATKIPFENERFGEIVINYGSHFNNLNTIIDHINMHQTSVTSTSKNSQNISLTRELAILSNPMNIAAMEISVDLSLDALKDFARERGVQSKNGLSIWSSMSKFKAQDTNLLGKTGVGVAANADKVYFTVYYYHTKLLNDIAKLSKELETLIANRVSEEKIDAKKVQILEKLSKVLTVNPFNLKDIRCISKLNWNIVKGINFDISERYLSALNDKQRNLLEVLKEKIKSPFSFQSTVEYMKTVGKDVDGPTLLSALVSAATDNAKELVLSKLNAFGDILDAYGMCATLGIPFEETAAIFTSPLLNVCVKEIRGDVYDPANFVSKLENSFGMFFAKFDGSKDDVRINSILSAGAIRQFTKDLEGDASRLAYDLDMSAGAAKNIETLKKNNGTIDDLIRKALENMNDDYSQSYSDDWDDDWEYILEAEIESSDDTATSYETLKWENANIIKKMGYVSFLKRLKLRNNAVIAELQKALKWDGKEGKFIEDNEAASEKLQSISKQIEDIKNISSSLMPKLYEQQMLHKSLGITKGIEGKPQQLYRFVRELEYFVNAKYNSNNLNQDFDFVEFFKNDEYAKEQIEKYESVREFTNVLECLRTNEYIGEMLKTVGDTNELLTKISFVYGNTQKIAKIIESELEMRRPLNHKEYGVIASLVHEWMIHEFLTYHSPYTGIKIKIDPKRNELIYQKGNYTNAEVRANSITINEMSDIMSFKRLANLFFFPDLLQDYAENKGSDGFGNTPNMFIEAIITGGYQRIIPNSNNINYASAIEEVIWKLAYNLNEDISDETSDYALQMKQDFEKIFKRPLRYKNENGEWVDRGITIGDFIYLYNLIAFKNSGSKNSFTKLFENAEELRSMSTILPQYNSFVALMDSGVRKIDITKNTDFINSIKMKLAAMRNSKLTDTVRRHKVETDFVLNRDYPFDFVLDSYGEVSTSAQADFYDQMTELITKNSVKRTTQSFGEPGIYYVQKSLLPENPELFVEKFGDSFVWVTIPEGTSEEFEDVIKRQFVKGKYMIITDPKLATFAKQHLDFRGDFRQSFIHSESEFIADKIASVLNDTVVRLPYNSTFLTILENTINKESDVYYKRPMLLQDAMRKLWDVSGLTKDGYLFDNFVKIETATTVGQYKDHRRFARAWFDYKDGIATVHINIDNCNDESVVLHEMAHLLLLIGRTVNYDKYRLIANSFLNAIYGGEYKNKWEKFKQNYPATVRDENGNLVQITEDLLFDEFLVDAVSKQKAQDWNLNDLIHALRRHTKTAAYTEHLNASRIISEKIASGEYEIKCD